MCRDFLKLGYSKLVVDPGVRLAYSADVARQRYTQKVPQTRSLIPKGHARVPMNLFVMSLTCPFADALYMLGS